MMFSIENLRVEVGGKEVIKGLDLEVEEGKVHIIFGPNGSGKTTLLGAIMGLPRYKIIEGDIKFMGKSIKHVPTHERARMGMALAFQHPPKVKGVKFKKLLETMGAEKEEIEKLASALNLKEHITREVNVGFSGGELKRSEIMQVFLQKPSFVMLDEPESGVDVENIVKIAKVIKRLLEKGEKVHKRRKSAIIITHTGYILDYLNADMGHVMIDGRIICSGSPRDLFDTIKKFGYERCAECLEK